MADETQLRFIQQQLEQYGVDVTDAIRQAIAREGARDTGALEESVRYRVLSAVAGHQGAVEILFREHGRFVDMGTGRGGRVQTTAGRRRRRVQGQGRRPKKIYGPPAYGFLGTLIGRLSYGYTQDVIRALKQAEP